MKPGAADRSYGIQVAKLAGLPGRVVARAREVLSKLEKADRRSRGGQEQLDELPLFAAAPQPAPPAASTPLNAAIEAVRPDEMSPKEALDKLYELKTLADSLKPATSSRN